MKMNVIRIERVHRSGVSKNSGKPFNLDMTKVTVQIPVNKPDVFGLVEKTYQYGQAINFTTLEQFKDKLPVELDIQIGLGVNMMNEAVEEIQSIKPLTQAK